MSEATDAYLAELEAADAEAAGLLDGPDGGGLDPRPAAVIKHLRAATKRHRKEIDRIRAEAITVARGELIAERQRESAFRRLAVPQSARALFGDLDPTDQQAMAARADELRQAGVTWPGQPQPPGPPPPDPNLAAQVAMMAAAAGGTHPDDAGDLGARMKAMEANPGKYSDEQHDAVVAEFNRAAQAAARPGSGARG